MKNIISLFLAVSLLGLSSCFKIDNWDAPDSTFFGTVYEVYNDENGTPVKRPILASQNDWQIRIWERSWTGHSGGATSSQDLRIKQDGTFQNTKLFAGTYDMLPDDGPFWTVRDTTKNVVLTKGKTTEIDFNVSPYMVIDGFTIESKIRPRPFINPGDPEPVLWIKWKIRAPMLQREYEVEGENGKETVVETIPNLHNTKVFLSLTRFCGQGDNSRINLPMYENDGRINFPLTQVNPANVVDNRWSVLINSGFTQRINLPNQPTHPEHFLGLSAAMNRGNGLDTSPEFDRIVVVKPGYTYYIRVGACTSSRSQRYNYSPIRKVVLGQQDPVTNIIEIISSEYVDD